VPPRGLTREAIAIAMSASVTAKRGSIRGAQLGSSVLNIHITRDNKLWYATRVTCSWARRLSAQLTEARQHTGELSLAAQFSIHTSTSTSRGRKSAAVFFK